MDSYLTLVVGALVLGATLAYTVAAFVQIQRDERLDPLSHVLWSLGVLVMPLIAPTAWFLLRHHGLVAIADIRERIAGRF